MAYDEFMADRLRKILNEKNVLFSEKKMMGGLCIMVDDKMLCGLLYNKKHETDVLMARIGEEAAEEAMKKEACHPMDFTGRPMKGYVFVKAEACDSEEDFAKWVQLCLDFNPLAKSSKTSKKKKKKV